jgi:predicted enzyme related to lactoylglutathione lyase
MTIKAWIVTLATPLLVAAAVEAQKAPSLTWEPSLLIQLQVKDLDRSIRFYEGTLGFKVTERRDDLQFAHVDCGLKGLQLGLSAGGTIIPGAATVVLNFGVTGDVEAARKALEAKGVVFLGPTVVIPGKVRLAEFRDPDGYRLRLAGDDK